MQQIIQTVKKT